MSESLTVDSFYEAASQGKLLGLRCEWATSPFLLEEAAESADRLCCKKNRAPGRGKILSWTEVFVKSKEFPVEAPYILALVELEEGGSLMGVIEGNEIASQKKYGADVTVVFRKLKEKEWPRIFFNLG